MSDPVQLFYAPVSPKPSWDPANPPAPPVFLVEVDMEWHGEFYIEARMDEHEAKSLAHDLKEEFLERSGANGDLDDWVRVRAWTGGLPEWAEVYSCPDEGEPEWVSA